MDVAGEYFVFMKIQRVITKGFVPQSFFVSNLLARNENVPTLGQYFQVKRVNIFNSRNEQMNLEMSGAHAGTVVRL